MLSRGLHNQPLRTRLPVHFNVSFELSFDILFTLECLIKAHGSLKHNPDIFCQKSLPHTSRDQMRQNISAAVAKFIRNTYFLRCSIEKKCREQDKTSLSRGPVLLPRKRNHTLAYYPLEVVLKMQESEYHLVPLMLQPISHFCLCYNLPIALPYIHREGKILNDQQFLVFI